jgi:integrase
MERACRAAGIPHYHPHDLRHRYISLLVAAGLPIPLVQRVVGHSRASTTLGLAQLRRGVFWCASGAPIVE